MTLPNERTNAVLNTRMFLLSLLDPKLTPKVPRAIREKAHRLLRHYPTGLYLDMAAKGNKNVFGRVMEEEESL